MARKPGAGRKAAKNESAAALLAALKFGSVLKTPTVTSMEQAHFVWMNTGTAIMYDGIVAAGHPIPSDIAGYPHAKLLADALDNTDKTFTLTVHEQGNFEIGSDTYTATVPSLSYDKVIPTIPDNSQAPIRSPENLLAAFENALKTTIESGDVVLYSSVRFTGNSILSTNGAVMLETRIDDNLPGIVVPRQFIAAVVKAAATYKLIGMGLGPDWKTFTVWFENGAWLRTNVYDNDTWPTDAIDLFYQAVLADRPDVTPLAPKLWAAIGAVLPFAEENNRVIIRPGLVRTHMDQREGAGIDVKECAIEFDTDGKRFMALAEVGKNAAVLVGFRVPVMVVFGDNCRGIVAGMEPLPDVVPMGTQQGGWGNGQPAPAPEPIPQAGGWAMQTNTAPAGETPAQEPRTAPPERPWVGGPAPRLGSDPEFLAVALGQDESDFRDDNAYVLHNPGDTGFVINPPATPGFTPSTWAENLTDEDGGFVSNNNTNGW